MPHDHHHHGDDHHHHHLSADAGDRRVVAAVGINVLLTVAQIIGGLIAGSVALIADGVHNFSDALALVLAFGARRLARRGADAAMSFGWARAEVVAALVNYVSLIIVAIWLMAEAVGRLIDPPGVDGWIVVWLAGLALVIDLGTAGLTWRLSKESVNIRAAFLHNMADAGASVAVIVGGILILLYDWRLVDPLLTIGISLFILWHVAGDIRPVLRILMLGAPMRHEVPEVAAHLNALPGIASVHHVHLWQIDEARNSFEAHLVLEDGADFTAVIARAKAMLAEEFGLLHVTLEPETQAAGCADQEGACPEGAAL
ncbi:cation diffusion facilitator family transporter [Pseudothioclava nitratireducens]|uniref:cation diffusion facilitator family transporter n=1 Tax=Pseudothioclava nitratireducens TaxID=1928646 RepID=UPI0023DC3119|nr:cation diffusion facilitator family transporter [Defluviimonas nitratireducens]MDF1619140.1 cation diffusion facilitator family transporter [Defluviimonas nitratireducens]